jgi:transcriptional regulator GlxA family with amidase domain
MATTDSRILRALAAIEIDYAQRWRVSQLAEQAGLSRSRFEHLFKQQTGDTFMLRLRDVRLTHAKSLLSDNSLSVKDIGFRCGYSSSASFSPDFKKTFHVSPTQYRRSTI